MQTPVDDRVREVPALLVTRTVAGQIADLTRRRFVALYPMGFEILVADDGSKQFRVFDEDGLATRLDNALAAAAMQSGQINWAVYDQRTGECQLHPATIVREQLTRQDFRVETAIESGRRDSNPSPTRPISLES